MLVGSRIHIHNRQPLVTQLEGKYLIQTCRNISRDISCDCDPKIRYVHIGRTEFGAASLSPKKFARTALDFLMHSIVLVDDLEIPL